MLAANGVAARIESACDVVARVVQQELRERAARALAEHVLPLPPEALQPAVALYQDAAAQERRRLGVFVRAYVDALHDQYAAAVHAIRPGVELPRPAPDADSVLLLLHADGYESSVEELRELCAALGLDGAGHSK